MGTSNLPFITPETNTAAYLVLEGFKLLGIQYEPRQNGKKRGFFIFEPSDTIKEFSENFEQGRVTVDYTKYSGIRAGLLDRVMKGLP